MSQYVGTDTDTHRHCRYVGVSVAYRIHRHLTLRGVYTNVNTACIHLYTPPVYKCIRLKAIWR